MKRNLLKIISVAVVLLIATIGCKKDKNVTNVTLDQNDITLEIGETVTLKATVYPEDAANKVVNWTSSNSTVADVVNGIVTAKEVGKTTITVITEEGNFTAECVVIVTPEWVEINGVKWAKRNVDMPGTFAAKPEDVGMYYKWGSSIGWSCTDPLINSNGDTIWYDIPPGSGTTWSKENDPCPSGWHVPTVAEAQSLIDATIAAEIWQWTTINGVNGRILGTDENTIFLPAAGVRFYDDGFINALGIEGYYWCNSALMMYGNLFGFDSEFIFGTCGFGGYTVRSNGYPLRCVAE